MNLLLLIATIIVSLVVVRIGAIAFQLTGLNWNIAKFQALSCFSGTGFTTREAELVLGHPQRRRIASYLMILGNAGLVTLIATFANSLSPDTIFLKYSFPYIPAFLPAILVPWINLGIIILALFLIYKYANSSALVKKLSAKIREKLIKNKIIIPVSHEELLMTTGDYGITQIEVNDKSPLLNKTLLASALKKQDISVLVIEREGKAIANPPSGTMIALDDRVVCFGKLENIREHLCVV